MKVDEQTLTDDPKYGILHHFGHTFTSTPNMDYRIRNTRAGTNVHMSIAKYSLTTIHAPAILEGIKRNTAVAS